MFCMLLKENSNKWFKSYDLCEYLSYYLYYLYLFVLCVTQIITYCIISIYYISKVMYFKVIILLYITFFYFTVSNNNSRDSCLIYFIMSLLLLQFFNNMSCILVLYRVPITVLSLYYHCIITYKLSFINLYYCYLYIDRNSNYCNICLYHYLIGHHIF